MSYSSHSARTEERTAAALAHASTIIAMIISAGWLSFVGPLVMWLLYKDRSPFVRRAAAGSFNFNIWAWVMTIVGWILIITVIGLPIGVVLLALAAILTVVCHTLGALRALKGEQFTYPGSIRILH